MSCPQADANREDKFVMSDAEDPTRVIDADDILELRPVYRGGRLQGFAALGGLRIWWDESSGQRVLGMLSPLDVLALWRRERASKAGEARS